MAAPLEHVRPGDLISALVWNSLVDKVNAMALQLDALGTSGPGLSVVITGLVPSGPIRIGQNLEILGQNFGFVRGAQRVVFDSEEVTEYKTGSSDTRLLVAVPQLPNITEAGRDVVLTVSNGYNAVTRTVRVLPVARPLEGNIIDVFWDTVNPNPITAGQSVTFGYRLHSRAGVSASFALNPVISIAALQPSLKVLDESRAEIQNKQITLAPGEERVFFVQTAVIPTGTTGTFSLSVNASAGAAVGSHFREYTIGQVITLPDPSFTLSVADFVVLSPLGQPDPASGSYNDGSRTIRLKPGAIGRMRLLAVFENQGSYTLRVRPIGTATGWDISLFDTSPSLILDDGDFPAGQNAQRNPQFGLSPQAGASARIQVEFVIERNGTSRGQSRVFTVELMS